MPAIAKGYLKAVVTDMDVADGNVTIGGNSEAMAKLIASNAALGTQISQVPSTMNMWRMG